MLTVSVRYIVDDVEAAIGFYTTHLGFTLHTSKLPAFADVVRGDLRLLLSGPTSSGGRTLSDGRRPVPGGWNRIHLIVEDLPREVERLRKAGLSFSERHRDRTWRVADRLGRSVGQPSRTVSAGRALTSEHQRTARSVGGLLPFLGFVPLGVLLIVTLVPADHMAKHRVEDSDCGTTDEVAAHVL